MLLLRNVRYLQYGLIYKDIVGAVFQMIAENKLKKSWPPGRFVCHPILCNGKCISSVYVRTSSILWHLHTFTVAFTLFYRIEGFIRDNGPYHILYPLNLRSALHQMKHFCVKDMFVCVSVCMCVDFCVDAYYCECCMWYVEVLIVFGCTW